MVLALVLPACTMAWGQQAEYESFEKGVPAYFTATRAESLSLSQWHSKQGKTSLRWGWREGEELVIRQSIGDVSRRGGLGNSNRASFAVGVYVEKPVPDALVSESRGGEDLPPARGKLRPEACTEPRVAGPPGRASTGAQGGGRNR